MTEHNQTGGVGRGELVPVDPAPAAVRPDTDIVVRPGEVPEVPVVDMPEVRDPDPVQHLTGRLLGTGGADRRPVVPDYLRTRQARRELYSFLARYAAHAAAFHTVRVPLYAARSVFRTPVGVFLALRALAGWVFDAEGRPLRAAAIGRAGTSSSDATREYLALTKIRNERVRHRGGLVLAVAGALALAWLVRLVQRWWVTPDGAEPSPLIPLPWWAWVLLVVVAVAVFGWIGAPADRPIVTRAVLATLAPRPTAPMVERALRATGVGGMSGKDAVISFPSEVARDGKGWRVEVDLPHGITVGEVLERRDKLASGLRRPVSAVWPEADPDAHAGRLVLWVGDQPLSRQRPRPWPLLKHGTVELLAQSFPFGADPRGRNIAVSLAEANMLIGSLPGGGKTAAIRVLACAAALDPYAELRIFEHKGTRDLGALEKCCHRYANGVADVDIEQTLISLRELVRELERRALVIAKLPRELVPDRKVTAALAKRPGLGLHPLVMIVDECFPAGTMIGDRRIEDVRPGDLIPSWDEHTGTPCQRRVVALMRHAPTAMVRVHFTDGAQVACTPNHPFLTRDGWTAAGDLRSTSEVLSYAEASAARERAVHDVHDGGRADTAATPLLAEDRPRVLLARMRRRVAAAGRYVLRAVGGRAGGAGGPDDGREPDVRSGGPGEDVSVSAGPGSPAAGARGERSRDDGASAVARRSVGVGLGSGVRHPDPGGAARRTPDALQGGHRAPDDADRGRGRRAVALQPQGRGRPEDGVPRWARVDRVEVLEPGRDGRYGGLCPDGLVYNFEVEGTHTYRVGARGLVAHNCQEVFTHADYGPEAGKLAEKIIRRGRALGVILILATQRPDKDSLPTGVSANVGIRFCLRVMGQVENDMILGTSAYKNGFRATTLSPSEKGVGYLAGVGDAVKVLRTYYLDDPATETVSARAHAGRVEAGTLSGHAVGDDEVTDPGPSFDLLADLAAVMATHGNPEPRSGKGRGRGRWLWSVSALGALEVLRPTVYAGLDPAGLGKALAAQKVPTEPMNRTDTDGERRNLVGFDEAGLRAALQARGEDVDALPVMLDAPAE